MPLWGNLDNATGNQKPLFANTSNTTVSSTINGDYARTLYGTVYGVSASEQPNTVPVTAHAQHSGWVSQKIGTGPVKNISIVTPGQGLNTSGFLLLTDGSWANTGNGVNISYTIANTQNTLQSSSSNSTLNGVATLTIVNGGLGWSNVDAISVLPTGTYTTAPTFKIELGGRAGRINYETIVATGTITGDDPRDNPFFPGT